MHATTVLVLSLAAPAAARLHGAGGLRARDLVGAGYCVRGPDATCYVSGWPSCCDATSPNGTSGGACPDALPPCELPRTELDASASVRANATSTAAAPAASAGATTEATPGPVVDSPDAAEAAPDPSAQSDGPVGTAAGPAYCAAAPDYACYATTENGLPSCCGDNRFCVSDAPPPCDGAAAEDGASYCADDPDADCYDDGWPRCCTDLGASCPDAPPPCEVPPPAAPTVAAGPTDVPDAAAPTTPDPNKVPDGTGAEAGEAAAAATGPTAAPTRKAIEGLGFAAEGEAEDLPESAAAAVSGRGSSIAALLTAASLFAM